MRIRHFLGALGGTITTVLARSTLGVVGSAPAYGHMAHAKTAARLQETPKDRHAIAKFDADIARLRHDFAVLPPEVNSVLVHAGPGSGSLLAAATAWNGLAQELQDTASSYESMISELTRSAPFGPASSPTAAASSPYVEWLRTTAQQAELAAAQAKGEATAYERAQETVPLHKLG